MLEGVLSLAGAVIQERAEGEVQAFAAGFPVASFRPSPVLGDALRSAFLPFTAGSTSSFGVGTTSIILTGGFQKI